ncbi:MAG: phospholipase A2, partial [Hydrogenophilaceae bacterium]
MNKRTNSCHGSESRMGKWLAILAAAGLALLGATAASGFDSYHSSTNYCGPKLEAYQHTLPNPVPSQPVPGVNFNNPCYEHDKCYGMCSSNCASKAMCDKDFKARMENICKSKPIYIRPACMDLAQTYYQAVNVAGGISYHCGTPACPDSTAVLPMGTPNADKAFFFEHASYAGASVEWS